MPRKTKNDGTPAKEPIRMSPEMRDRVLSFVANGGAVKRIAEADYVAGILEEDPGAEHPAMPSQFAVWDAIRKDEEFAKHYRDAKQFAMELLADEVVAIADEAGDDFLLRKDGSKTTNWESIGRSKLKCDVRIKMMGMLSPKRFAQQVNASLTGGDGGPVRLIIEK